LGFFGEKYPKLGKTWVKLGKSWVVLGCFFWSIFADFKGGFTMKHMKKMKKTRATILTGLQDKRKI
jgi:hypothetical protein